MLRAEGFITSRQGAPPRVAGDLPLDQPLMRKPAAALEVRGSALAWPGSDVAPQTYQVDFRTGQPDLRSFPRYIWHRFLYQAAGALPLEQLGYTGPDGQPALREQIAAWLYRSRGLLVDPRSVFITAGATHALHLLAGLLYKDGHEILMEDPCHTGMLRALQAQGCPVRPVPVDSHGLQTASLDGKGACAVYVTPSHQFPLGGILPANRRAALVRFAREHDLYIIEDDYDSEFRYDGAPVAPLHSIDPQRVIYVGTFSKILFPALRVGYAILPEPLHERWRYLRTHSDVQNPPFEQAALAEFIRTRRLDRHVQHMRGIYRQRRAALLQALAENFGDAWQIWGDAAGLHVAVSFPGRRFDQRYIAACQEGRVRAIPVEHHSIHKGAHLDKLLLGYGHLEPAEIRAGIALLGKVIGGM
jgi:GntR family transcriptional regulator/MocR family aminotransferase